MANKVIEWIETDPEATLDAAAADGIDKSARESHTWMLEDGIQCTLDEVIEAVRAVVARAEEAGDCIAEGDRVLFVDEGEPYDFHRDPVGWYPGRGIYA